MLRFSPVRASRLQVDVFHVRAPYSTFVLSSLPNLRPSHGTLCGMDDVEPHA
jgi:hypothetical protein